MREGLQQALEQLVNLVRFLIEAVTMAFTGLLRGLVRARMALAMLAALGATGYGLYRNPPLHTIEAGEVGVRTSRISGAKAEFHEGSVLVIPGLHELKRHSLRDRLYKALDSASASGAAPFQSIEGLSIGVDLGVRYALDPAQLTRLVSELPPDIDREVVEPAVQGVIYKIFARYTVKEIFSTKRAEIQEAIEGDLKPQLARDGIVLRSVQIGKVDLPPEYRAGLERLLAEEQATEKMKHTLVLKDQQVKESELEAEAQKVRRQKEAEASAQEQVIAARAQEETMKHILPFKEKQIQQRRLEAEAEKTYRIRQAQATAQARRIEAAGEADSRRKLADAETYRLENVGKVSSAQLARDGELVSKYPLLIQKTMADKLSDRVSVIIAAPPANGSFIGSTLLGQGSVPVGGGGED
jgi:regulator of protease activity HflC (stomatin/prohibitin superfamily)